MKLLFEGRCTAMRRSCNINSLCLKEGFYCYKQKALSLSLYLCYVPHTHVSLKTLLCKNSWRKKKLERHHQNCFSHSLVKRSYGLLEMKIKKDLASPSYESQKWVCFKHSFRQLTLASQCILRHAGAASLRKRLD